MNLIKEMAGSRPCWTYVNTQESNNHLWDPDESYIRFCVNSHLAYGYKGILYFPYEYPPSPFAEWNYDWHWIKNVNGLTDKYTWIQQLNNYINNVVEISSWIHIG